MGTPLPGPIGYGNPAMPSRAHLLPVLAAVAGIALFSSMDALMKKASIAVGAYDAVFWRNAFGAVLGLPLWLLTGLRFAGRKPGDRRFLPDAGRLRIHILRSVLVAGMSILFFWGLVRVPMAEAMALSFIAPLIALYLAAAFLGEPVTRRALVASALGFAGVCVIALARWEETRTSGDHLGALAGIGAILASAVAYAANLVLQRHQAQLASPGEIAFFQHLLVFVVVAPFAPRFGQVPDIATMALLAAAAALALVSLMLLAWGYARAEAHRLLPVEYSGFVWAAWMGWWWFGEPVGWATLAGVVLIVGGCAIGTASPPPEQVAL